MQPQVLPADQPPNLREREREITMLMHVLSASLFVSRSVCIAVTDFSTDFCTTRTRQGLQQRYTFGVVTVILNL